MGDPVENAKKGIILTQNVCDDLYDVVIADGSPELTLNYANDFYWMGCSEYPPAQIDYYIKAFSNLKDKLLSNTAFDKKKVTQKLDPAISLFRSAKSEKRTLVSQCMPSECSAQISNAWARSFERATEKNVEELSKKFQIKEISKRQNQIFMSRVVDNSDVLVIFWPDIHNGIGLKSDFLQLVAGIEKGKEASTQFFMAVEGSDNAITIPKKFRKTIDRDKKRMLKIIESVVKKYPDAHDSIDKIFLEILGNDEIVNLIVNCARKILPKASFNLIAHNHLVGRVADLLLETIFPEKNDHTWRIEDSKLYKQQMKEIIKDTRKVSLNLAEERSRTSVNNLMKRIEDEKKRTKGKIIVVVEQGLYHSRSFLDALNDKPVNIIGMVSPSIMSSKFLVARESKENGK